MEDAVTLTIVIVNFNNDDVLRGCLESLPQAISGLATEVILSDNGSVDGSVEWVREHFPEIRIVENGENLGFAEGNNRAFAYARGKYVLLLNPDTIVLGDAFRPMIKVLEEHPRAGAVGCKLLERNGKRQISARNFPLFTTYLYRLLGLDQRFSTSRRFGRFQMTWWNGDDTRQVDWVCGAVLMIPREVLEAPGGMDPYFFLTYDEVDWCHRIQDEGYEVWYTAEAEIIHLYSQSEPQSNPSPEARIKYLTVERNSRVHYFVRHHGVLYATLVEAVLIGGNAALWLKAKLGGTKRSEESQMEMRLLVALYWRTALRVPKAALQAVLRAFGAGSPYRVLANPYLER